MKQDRTVPLGEYKARRLGRTKHISPTAVEKSLPDADRLWELLDRNINLSVWKKEN